LPGGIAGSSAFGRTPTGSTVLAKTGAGPMLAVLLAMGTLLILLGGLILGLVGPRARARRLQRSV
jgi:hypothetical protein